MRKLHNIPTLLFRMLEKNGKIERFKTNVLTSQKYRKLFGLVTGQILVWW